MGAGHPTSIRESLSPASLPTRPPGKAVHGRKAFTPAIGGTLRDLSASHQRSVWPRHSMAGLFLSGHEQRDGSGGLMITPRRGLRPGTAGPAAPLNRALRLNRLWSRLLARAAWFETTGALGWPGQGSFAIVGMVSLDLLRGGSYLLLGISSTWGIRT